MYVRVCELLCVHMLRACTYASADMRTFVSVLAFLTTLNLIAITGFALNCLRLNVFERPLTSFIGKAVQRSLKTS